MIMLANLSIKKNTMGNLGMPRPEAALAAYLRGAL